jgi:hypothetical protein
MRRLYANLCASACLVTTAHTAPLTSFDCTPDSVRLRGLHMLYTVNTGQGWVHESMSDASGAPYTPDSRKFQFHEQTLPAEFDEMVVMWSAQSPLGPINRTLDRTSNVLSISEPVRLGGQMRIEDTRISCTKLKKPGGAP